MPPSSSPEGDSRDDSGKSGAGGGNPWLVVVDMQNVFARVGSPWQTPGFADVVPANGRLVEAFGERVVFTRFVAPQQPAGAWVDYYEQWPFALVPPDDELYDVVADLPYDAHPVVTRTTFGKWDDKPGSLREATQGASTLVVSGVSTDCCVLSTVLAAADAGVHVRVVEDACAGLSDEDHQRAIDAMRLYYPLVSITSAAVVLAGW